MIDLDVLVATVNNDVTKLYNKMNLSTNAIISNQTNYDTINRITISNRNITEISTTTRGVGINRNLGLLFSTADYLLIADDDNIYVDNYNEIVNEAFKKLPKADIIVFQLQYIKDNKIIDEDKYKMKRVHLYNSLNIGAPKMAIKSSSIKKNNILFNTLFGGGTMYSSGEDSKFVVDCLRNKLKIYTYPVTIAKNIRDTSSWFNGYTEKFFFDKGAFLACTFNPLLKYGLMFYFAFRFKQVKEFSFVKKIKLMIKGSHCFRKNISYIKWHNSINEQ